MYFMFYVFTAWKVEKWFVNQRNEMGRQKNDMKGKKSGSKPKKWTKKKHWRWQNMFYLFDHIVLRGHGEDTGLTTSDEESDSESVASASSCRRHRSSPRKTLSGHHSKSPSKSPSKTRKDKGQGKKSSQSQSQADDLQASLSLMVKSNIESNKLVST
jgi:hypothetical protein